MMSSSDPRAFGLGAFGPGALRADTRSLSVRERRMMTVIRSLGQTTRSELIREMDLSGPAVFRASEDLAALGLIEIGPAVARGRGQPSASIWIRANAAVSAGLSVTADAAHATLMNLAGSVIGTEDITLPNMPLEGISDRFAQFIDAQLRRLGARSDRLVGAGVAVAGYFVDDGRRLNPREELEDWALVDVGARLSRHIGVPVEVENIASAAAIGEALLGVGRNYRNFAYINIASGLGAGIILNGELVRGTRGNTGEIGGVPELTNLPKPDLISLLKFLQAHGVEVTSIRDIIEHYDDRWPGLQEWVDLCSPSLAMLARLLHSVLDIEAVVIGGRLPSALTRRLVEAIIWPPADHKMLRGHTVPFPVIVPASLSSEAATVGAAATFLKNWYFT